MYIERLIIVIIVCIIVYTTDVAVIWPVLYCIFRLFCLFLCFDDYCFCFVVVVVAWLLLLFPIFIYSMYKHILCVQMVSMQSIAFAERKLIESTRYHLTVNKHCNICNGMPTISHIVRICMAICAYNNSKRPFESLNCKNRNMVLCHGKNYFDFTAIR